MSDTQYLDEGFDPTTLKVPHIRNLLNKHNIAFPSNAKKPELLELLTTKVLSNTGLRREAKKRARPDSSDIEVVVGIGARTRARTPKRKTERDIAEEDSDVSVSERQAKRTQRKKKPKRKEAAEDRKREIGEDKKKEIGEDNKKETAESKKRETPEGKKKETAEDKPIRKRKHSDEPTQEEPAREPGRRIKRRLTKDSDSDTRAPFSDENPFQSSPETTRKRRKKTQETPMSALRKSQVSELSFKVALPRQSSAEEQEGFATPKGKVSDLVARYESSGDAEVAPRSPTVRIRDGLPKHEMLFGAEPVTPVREPRDAGAEHREPRAHKPADHGLPPIAPNIPVVPVHGERPVADSPIGHAGEQPDAFEQLESDAQALQRRRVATLRQHSAHSRRSSAASIASIADVPGVPAAPAAAPAAPAAGKKGGFPWWMLLTVMGFWMWRIHEQFAIGFGGPRADTQAVVPLDSVLTPPTCADDSVVATVVCHARRLRALYVEPQPLQCPEHATCVPFTAIPWGHTEGGPRDQWTVLAPEPTTVLKCDPGFVVQFAPLASRLYPVAPTCVRDLSLEHRIGQLVGAMAHVCSIRRGQAHCEMSLMDHARELLNRTIDSGAEDEAEEIEKLGVSINELRDLMWARRAPRLTQTEFAEVFKRAVDRLSTDDRVMHFVLEDDDTETGYFVSKQPQYTLLCLVRRALLAFVLGNIRVLIAVLSVVFASFVLVRRLAFYRAERASADSLVVGALMRLKRQARRHYLDPALSPSPVIPSAQLRDLLTLAGPVAPGVWDRAKKAVEKNANVRCRTTAVRGEPMRVWEWIGPLDEDDDEMFTPFASPLGSPQTLNS
ncbi:inner nuclear membrane protein enriched at telomere/subtelomere region [Coemansia spiralis]|uniref:Inner nuclear membrane protein enriched at telomere/subtelomere region n=2 Tax=Coemansia TaxID=4863 RepID=A0A9W8KZF8_9FUNG|nr:Man1-Src1p-C-terminal domain-containing protein [Coemansia spiralis]KAJ1986573.1 inner nuclear membrane protein enriched at telomere/subtelomere region [Coemansia umbellata]KAJ2623238.1 inner nuclear membrane protein enriched at telomere/subtelomere region [Coemansia sp. RSA 1358]KAJ2678790.1 inner nuclear membrane protein enriched at telomere/subtelomere region [Coemansia spiralis]